MIDGIRREFSLSEGDPDPIFRNEAGDVVLLSSHAPEGTRLHMASRDEWEQPAYPEIPTVAVAEQQTSTAQPGDAGTATWSDGTAQPLEAAGWTTTSSAIGPA